jgi:hypothetical protein
VKPTCNKGTLDWDSWLGLVSIIIFLITVTLTVTFTLILLHGRWYLWFTPLPCYISESHNCHCIIGWLICLCNKNKLLVSDIIKTETIMWKFHCKTWRPLEEEADSKALLWMVSVGCHGALSWDDDAALGQVTTIGHLLVENSKISHAPPWPFDSIVSTHHTLCIKNKARCRSLSKVHLRCVKKPTHLGASNTEQRMWKVCPQDSLSISHYVKAACIHNLSHNLGCAILHKVLLDGSSAAESKY